ncbi:MAG: hypothetical protein M3P30_11310 [Chloroflexota bacterium]|nr:hypothetical protein [Chloroflexota bacterium]
MSMRIEQPGRDVAVLDEGLRIWLRFEGDLAVDDVHVPRFAGWQDNSLEM